MERSKFNSGTIRKAFLAIVVFNFANLILHFISCYFPVVFLQLDYGLYIAKISIYLALYLFLKKNFGNCFIVCQRFIMATIVLDAAELYMSNMRNGNFSYILLLFVLFKFILDCLLFMEYKCIAMQESFVDRDYEKVLVNRENNSWIKFNIFILTCFGAAFFSKQPLLLFFTVFMLIVRFVYEILIIRSASLGFRFYEGPKVFVEDKTLTWMIHRTGFYRKNKKCNPVLKKCLLGAVGIILLLGLYAYFSYDDNMDHVQLSSKQELKYRETEGISCYYVSNKMPEWTGLRREKFGFTNNETGMDTGARFKSIDFDKTGITWDGDDKYIDRNGNTITMIPFAALITTSHRQHILRYFVTNSPRFLDGYTYDYYGHAYDDHDDCIDYWNSMSELRDKYFNNSDYFTPAFQSGVTVFYSGFYDCYGLLRKDGTIAAKPVYRWLEPNDDSSLAYIQDKRGNHGVINSDGKVLIKHINFRSWDFYLFSSDIGVFAFESWDDKYIYQTDNGERLYHLMDKDGNEWDGLYSFMVQGTQVKTFHKYTGDYEYTTIAVSDGKILFESDQYEEFIGEKEDDGRVTELIGIKKSGEKETIYLE
ncbi:hypothetical protein D6856_10540 [Butyrivibrio sp. XB500-5]|uniref:hypothetical protein n=1 Tax=Butyrivibrio sp. XB500-5 TaxID=2364880 RepID=UPI000EAA56EC|nr:hypothetical protein [Butyrivibrio sp. XB500-5]RKM59642.1 hypothetical protein D6856_10540 [Butyrivibrio sp. XB500-5]